MFWIGFGVGVIFGAVLAVVGLFLWMNATFGGVTYED